MTSLTLVRRIAARPSLVFEAMIADDGIRGWWGPDGGPVLIAESDPRVGGRFRVRFRMLDGSEHECSGEYLEVDPPRRLAMSFRWHGAADDTGPSRIDIALTPTPGGTELVFTHSRLRDEEVRVSHTWGWNGALDKLEAMFASPSVSQGDAR